MKRLYLYPLLLSLLATACKQKKEAAPGEETDLAALKGSTLNILCWEGYAEKAFTNGFEEKYGVTVKGTYFTSSDDLIAKLQNGGGAVYDLVSPSSDVASKLVEGGLIEPLDISKLSAWNDFSPLFKDMKDVQKDGKIYGMPFTWGPDYLVYNADEIKEEPTSWSIFWNPKYKGKVAVWDDISNIYLMGQILATTKPMQALFTTCLMSNWRR
jgi:spermidine/putrescine-binding protein